LIGVVIYVVLQVRKAKANPIDDQKIDFNEEVVLVRYKKPYYNREAKVESPDVLSSRNV